MTIAHKIFHVTLKFQSFSRLTLASRPNTKHDPSKVQTQKRQREALQTRSILTSSFISIKFLLSTMNPSFLVTIMES